MRRQAAAAFTTQEAHGPESGWLARKPSFIAAGLEAAAESAGLPRSCGEWDVRRAFRVMVGAVGIYGLSRGKVLLASGKSKT